MTQFVGYGVSDSARLVAPSPKELITFLEHRLSHLSYQVSPDELITQLNSDLTKNFGPLFNASLVDPYSYLPYDEYDTEVLLLVDSTNETLSTSVH